MAGIGGTIARAAGMFAGTNVDDIIVLTVFFLTSRAGRGPRAWQIWAGQYLGIAVLVLVSLAAALGLTFIPDNWGGLLGLVPFVLGVRGLVMTVRAGNRGEERAPPVVTGLMPVAWVTIANGADNVSVYTPVFRSIDAGSTIVTVVVFAVGVAVWCLAGSWLGSHKKIVDVVRRYGQWIVPAVFIVIGTVIVVASGVLTELW
ncbi:cadmium resistance transporter [Actinoallomurus iriomotensis]|uniref:Cadmium transporter n=1 Tax=Actinoallomurus iriomotensis TaxID=478107 RepID=A0A9W6VU35_9ACTN|nr:cadmium resistance transporter [Actinoallomurus iriomotensis]GLY78291.1 cadmium transporter [Actinoallomurus iriomotensis]